MENQPKKEPISQEKIAPRVIEDEMKKSYLDYAMSVIVGRALPDVKDGLKPVHRRILFAMNEMGMFHNKPFKKSARIVGEVLGKYHPHGDTAVYDSLVRMAQGFSLRYPLIDGQGNFGSIDGDRAAAMRYTEARLAKIAEELLIDIKKNTVDFKPNFDGSLKEPIVLPAKLPNLLINGSAGIAVGMATNIPPHNVGEIIDGTVALIDNPDIDIKELINYVQGPDFPTGGLICGKGGITSAYLFGRGRATIRARTDTEEVKDRQKIIVKEIPYMVNKAVLIQQIAQLVREKKIKGISDLRDESDREGMRVVIELKKNENPDVVLNQLYNHTRLQTTYSVILLALVDGQPKVLNLKQILQYYIDHRVDVIRRRTQFDLDKAKQRAHILEGLVIALNDIDNAVQLIKQSKSAKIAKEGLIAKYKLTEIQAQAILDMKLQSLTSLEQDKLKQERKDLLALIEELKAILADQKKVLEIIKKELISLKDKYGDKRRTEFIAGDNRIIQYEDMIKEEDMVVTVTHSGYVKRLPINTYRMQRRGGKGVIAQTTKEEDFIEDIFVANTHSYLLLFTNKGQVHWIKVYEIPEAGRTARGKAIVNLVQLDKDERVATIIPVKKFDQEHYLVMATKKGIVKKTSLVEYSRPRRGGIRAITLEEGDGLVNAILTDGNQKIMLATKNGLAIKFDERNARAIGRTSKGVKGITLKKGDAVIDMVVAYDDRALLTVTENGYGKRTPLSDYRVIGRGGVGVINIKTNERNGCVAAIKPVEPGDEVMLISQHGIVIRTPVKGISVIGRNTSGVRLMRLSSSDKVVACARILSEEKEEEEIEKKEEDKNGFGEVKVEPIIVEEEIPVEEEIEEEKEEEKIDEPEEIIEDKVPKIDELAKKKKIVVDHVPSIQELAKKKK